MSLDQSSPVEGARAVPPISQGPAGRTSPQGFNRGIRGLPERSLPPADNRILFSQLIGLAVLAAVMVTVCSLSYCQIPDMVNQTFEAREATQGQAAAAQQS